MYAVVAVAAAAVIIVIVLLLGGSSRSFGGVRTRLFYNGCVGVCSCVWKIKQKKEKKRNEKREELECVGGVISRKIRRNLSGTYRSLRPTGRFVLSISCCVFALFASQNTALRCC